MTRTDGHLIDRLAFVAETFCAARGLSVGRVSTLVFNDGSKLGDLIDGRADITTRRYERALLWFADHWPEGAVWPAAIARPDKFEPSPQDGAVLPGASAPAGPDVSAPQSGPAFSSRPSRANVGEEQDGAVAACSADPASRGPEVLIASSPRVPGFAGDDDGRDVEANGGASSVVTSPLVQEAAE